MRILKPIKWIFDFHEEKKKLSNLILIAFVVSFFAVRIFSSTVGWSVFYHGYHIHHFYFGMFILSVGGVMGVLSHSKWPDQIASVLVGIGIGLFADEIGLLLNCTTPDRECVYAFPATYDIIMAIASVILLIIVIVGIIDKRLLYSKIIMKESPEDRGKSI